MSGLIAIVGRPNVGKSALFNRIAGRRIAIVHDRPGVTRDRITAEVEWGRRSFTLVDTGGLGLLRGEKSEDIIERATADQVQVAIEATDVVILVVDAHEGIRPLDQEVAIQLRKSGKPVILAANKADSAAFENRATEFSELGFDPVMPVSALHNRGCNSLLKQALKYLPAKDTREESEDHPGETAAATPLKLAIVGRPNVGKSSIINALTESERVIVSDMPGTTRDAVDVPFVVTTDGIRHDYLLIDTAGIRKRRQVKDSVEFYSVKRSESSIKRCDIAVFVLDAESGILEQDKKIGDTIVQEQKACVIVVNKWDLFQEKVKQAQQQQKPRPAKGKTRGKGQSVDEISTLAEFGQWVQRYLFFLDYAPVIFTSAKSGFHLERLLEAVRYVADQLKQTVPTALLNRTIRTAMEEHQPISEQGHFLKFFYATQVKQSPPTIVLFVNRNEFFSEPYKKFLVHRLRQSFGFEGCPIVLLPRARPKTIEPIRRNDSKPAGKAKSAPRRGPRRKGTQRRSKS